MTIPFFYIDQYDPSQKIIQLDEDTARHVVQVLRMKEGEGLNLTDGKGNLINCQIKEGHKKHCLVEVKDTRYKEQGARKVSIGMSLLKNTNRFEWFLEKATEIGVIEIMPMICERTVREKFRYDRMKSICISAMLQSQQYWLPVLHEPQTLDYVLKYIDGQLNMIAHCEPGEKKTIHNLISQFPLSSYAILIGPEGDFTPDEIFYAEAMQFFPVTLGETRLRTETAGVVAATLMCTA